jgi:hypothetical protein
MTRLLHCILVVLELFRDEDLHWYEIMCSLNLLVDVLYELNDLNIKFHYDMVDVTTIDITILILSLHFYLEIDLCLVVQARIWEIS